MAVVGGPGPMAARLAAILRAAPGLRVVGVSAGPRLPRERRPGREARLSLIVAVSPTIADLQDLRDRVPRTRALIVGEPDGWRIAAVRDGTAHGIVAPGVPDVALLGGIRQVLADHLVLPRAWRSVGLARAHDPALSALGTRRLEILELLAEGCTNEQIATRLHLSVNTVKFHLRTAYEELGVHSRARAAALLRA